jgi:hypothetical protein
VRFQALKAASMMNAAFYDITPYSLVEVDRSFRGAYCLHHHGYTSLHGAISKKAAIFMGQVVQT